MRIAYLITCGWLLLSANLVLAETYIVTRVFDGDTVEIKASNRKFKLRLADIDAPERSQAYGQKSRRALAQLCQGNHRLIHVETIGLDKYNRYLGHLTCNQADVELRLTMQGLAWHNAKYSNNMRIQNAEHHARQQRVGLWRAKTPTPPWVWRQKHRRYDNASYRISHQK